MSAPAPIPVVTTLGVTQTLAWASSYYLPAMLALPMARDLGVSAPTVFAAFSCALIASAVVGPRAGRLIDQRGGRPVLMATNVLFAVGLTALGLAQDTWSLFASWLLIGLAMGGGLYDAAFATIVRIFGQASRSSITGVTLIAGFASTIGWPLSTLLEVQIGWRGTCFVWAAMHIVVGLPLNALIPRYATRVSPQEPPEPAASKPNRTKSRPGYVTIILAFVFATTLFVTSAMAVHLPTLLQASGASLAVAVGAGALIGPAQVAARLLEFGFMRNLPPLFSARLATLGHPLGALALLIFGAPAAVAFAILHGGGNGLLTIAKGTLPLALFGSTGYGARQGWLMMPARVAQALAPFLFGLALQLWGANTLWISAALGLSAFVALMLVSRNS